MKRQINIILLCLIVLCCKEKSKTDNIPAPYEGNRQNLSKKTEKTYNVSPKNLFGVWFTERGDNAIFNISADSIYYVDNLRSYKYEIRADTLKINFDGWISKSLIVKLTTDSLILMDFDDKSISFFMKDSHRN